MATSGHIAIRTNGNRFAHVRVNYDAYPEHMLAALANVTDEEILAAREIRGIDENGKIEAYGDAATPEERFEIRVLEAYTYYRNDDGSWAVA